MSLLVDQLTCRMGGRTVLDNLAALEARRGEITALLGPNGAGKSSLLKGIAGLTRTRGHIELDGMSLNEAPLAARAEHLYYLPQEIGSRSALTVFEAVLLAWEIRHRRHDHHGLERVRETLHALELEAMAERELATLSAGQRQRVSIAQAVVREPRLLLLDEPTSALDLHHQLQVLDWLTHLARTRDCIVVMAIHDLSLAARFATHLWMLKEGRHVASGTPGEVLTEARLRDVYAIETHIEWSEHGPLRITPLAATRRLGQ